MKTATNGHTTTGTAVARVGDDAATPELSADLTDLAAMANRNHAECVAAGRSTVEAAWHSGRALLAAKAQCRHGEWLPWLKAHFEGSQQTANRYMTVASNYSCMSNLDPAKSINTTLKAITSGRSGERKPTASKSTTPKPDEPGPAPAPTRTRMTRPRPSTPTTPRRLVNSPQRLGGRPGSDGGPIRRGLRAAAPGANRDRPP